MKPPGAMHNTETAGAPCCPQGSVDRKGDGGGWVGRNTAATNEPPPSHPGPSALVRFGGGLRPCTCMRRPRHRPPSPLLPTGCLPVASQPRTTTPHARTAERSVPTGHRWRVHDRSHWHSRWRNHGRGPPRPRPSPAPPGPGGRLAWPPRPSGLGLVARRRAEVRRVFRHIVHGVRTRRRAVDRRVAPQPEKLVHVLVVVLGLRDLGRGI